MNLLKTLPLFWQEDPVLQQILDMIQPEVDRLETLKEQLFAAASLVDAAGWVLQSWENAYGVAPVSELDTERISSVRAKMRAGGILTPDRLQQIMRSYYGGETEITEDVANGLFQLKFVSQIGTPTNIDSVAAMLDAVKPAQLVYELAYEYLRIKEVEGMTLSALSTVKLDRFGGGTTYVDNN